MSRQLVEEILGLVEQSGALHLLLDFHRVGRVSIEFFCGLKALADEIGRKGGTMRFCGLPSAAAALLKEVGVAPDLHMGHSAEHAVRRYLRYLRQEGYLRPSSAPMSDARVPSIERDEF